MTRAHLGPESLADLESSSFLPDQPRLRSRPRPVFVSSPRRDHAHVACELAASFSWPQTISRMACGDLLSVSGRHGPRNTRNGFRPQAIPRSLDRADPSDPRLRDEPGATTVGPDQSSMRRCRRPSCLPGCLVYVPGRTLRLLRVGDFVRRPRPRPLADGGRSCRPPGSP